MFKKILNRKKSESDSSSDDEGDIKKATDKKRGSQGSVESLKEKDKKGSLDSLKAKFERSPKKAEDQKQKSSQAVVTKSVRPRRSSSSDEERRKTSNSSDQMSYRRSQSMEKGALPSGTITITLHKAKNLQKTGVFGKSDPYVALIVGKDKYKSGTVKNNQNPEWNYVAKFPVNKDTAPEVMIEVFDEDIGKDDLMGQTKIMVKEIVTQKKFSNIWIPLQKCKSGEVLISAEFVPATPSHHNTPQEVKPVKAQLRERKASSSSDDEKKSNTSSPAPQPANRRSQSFETIGSVTLTLVKARNLQKTGLIGKSDPYTLVTVGHEKFKSHTVKNNQNPEWNYVLKFPVTKPLNDSGEISIDVFDEDVGKDDLMGQTKIPVGQIVSQRRLNQWFSLQRCKSGEVLISAEFVPGHVLTPQSKKESAKAPLKEKKSVSSDDEKKILPSGTVTLTLFKARNLAKSGFIGKSDPYTLVTVGKEKFKSKTINNNQNPEWNYVIKFGVTKGTAREVFIEVFDEDVGKDDLMGQAKILVSQIVNQKKLNQWIPLQGCKSGEVLISAEFVAGNVHVPSPPKRSSTSNGTLDRQRSRKSSTSSSSSSSSQGSIKSTGGNDLKGLNNRLVNYIERVRLLQQANDAWKNIPQEIDRSGDLETLRVRYEAELAEWRKKYEESQGGISKIKIELEHAHRENDQLKQSNAEKADIIRDRDAALTTLESEIAELLGKLNLMQNEKDRMKEHEKSQDTEIAKLKAELELARKALDQEKLRSFQLEEKLNTIEKELRFRIQILEKELQDERNRKKINFGDIDEKLKSDYEKRLRAELERLRKLYEEQIEISKNEFMHMHSKKIAELQALLSEERSHNNGAALELKDCTKRLEQFKARITELESTNLSLDQRTSGLQLTMDEQASNFRAQIAAKDQEVSHLHNEITSYRREYESIMEVKLALDLEIGIYKKLIEAEENRLRSSTTRRLKNGSASSSSSSSSESEKDQAEESGFFEKAKDKIADGFRI